MTAAAPWAELADLAEHELTLAREGRWPELAACSGERVRRAAALPLPPAQARPELERLAACQDALTAVLGSAHALAARELGALRRGGRAARGYASAAVGAGPMAHIDDRG
jgi:hypothetical protein